MDQLWDREIGNFEFFTEDATTKVILDPLVDATTGKKLRRPPITLYRFRVHLRHKRGRDQPFTITRYKHQGTWLYRDTRDDLTATKMKPRDRETVVRSLASMLFLGDQAKADDWLYEMVGTE